MRLKPHASATAVGEGNTLRKIFFFLVFINFKEVSERVEEEEGCVVRMLSKSWECEANLGKTGGRSEPWGEEESRIEKGKRKIFVHTHGCGPTRVALVMRLPR